MKKKLIVIVVVVLVIVLAIVGVFFYRQRFNNNPRYVFEKFFDEITDSEIDQAGVFNNVFDNISTKVKSPGRINFDASVKIKCSGYCDRETENFIDGLNYTKINATFDYDLSKLLANLDYKINYDNKDLINGTANYMNDDLYLTVSSSKGDEKLRFRDFFNEFFGIDNKELKSSLEETKGTIDDVVGTFKNASSKMKQANEIMKSNLKDEYFSKSDEVIDIDGKSTKVKKYSLTMSKDEMNDFIDGMRKDSEGKDEDLFFPSIFNFTSRLLKPGYSDIDDYDSYGYNLNLFINPKNNSIERIELNRDGTLTTLEKTKDGSYRASNDDGDEYEIKFTNGLLYNIVEEGDGSGKLNINNEQIYFMSSDDYSRIELNIDLTDEIKADFNFMMLQDYEIFEITGKYEEDKLSLDINAPRIEMDDDSFDINFKIDLNVSPIKEVKEISIKDYKTCSDNYENYCSSEKFYENISKILSVLPFELF